MALALALSLASALCYAVGWVLQYREAVADTAAPSLSPRLLLRLVHDPLWLCGIAAMVAGNVLQAVALDVGSLTIVEPVLVTSLLFSLALGSVMTGERVLAREWLAALGVAVGLAVFLLAASPSGGRANASPERWIGVGAAVLLASASASAIGLYHAKRRRTELFASAGGIVFGMQDALTKAVLATIGTGAVAIFGDWKTYVLVLCAVYGLLLAQDAYKGGELARALPPLLIFEPVIGTAIGVLGFSERLNASLRSDVLEAVAGAAMVVGGVVLARSPVVMARCRPGGASSVCKPAATEEPEGDEPVQVPPRTSG